MQTTAIGTVANSLPENEVILLTFLISKGYILFVELRNKSRCSKNADKFVRSNVAALWHGFQPKLVISLWS